MKKVTTKNLRATALIALRKLGILDSKGKPKEEMMAALKALHIDVKDLEPKSYDEFL